MYIQAEHVVFRMILCFIFHEQPDCKRYLQSTTLSQTYGTEVVYTFLTRKACTDPVETRKNIQGMLWEAHRRAPDA